jgi:RNA polymerase sigma factor (sigma-70 family)
MLSRQRVDLDSHARPPTGRRPRAKVQARFNALPEELEAMASRAVFAESTDDDVALREARRKVQAALATLSRAEREVLELAYWGGLTQSEIATALGIPSGTVKSRTFTALARLREALSRGAELTAAP